MHRSTQLHSHVVFGMQLYPYLDEIATYPVGDERAGKVTANSYGFRWHKNQRFLSVKGELPATCVLLVVESYLSFANNLTLFIREIWYSTALTRIPKILRKLAKPVPGCVKSGPVGYRIAQDLAEKKGRWLAGTPWYKLANDRHLLRLNSTLWLARF